MLEGFCENCANNLDTWFNGEFLRVRCAKLGVINRSDIKYRCGEWGDKRSAQEDLFAGESIPAEDHQRTLFDE